jgi:metal-sulfur cluster biosynthetic enzyme
MPRSNRVAEVWAALEPVIDPELDESVVQLGFVTLVEVDGSAVAVSFELPTAWCSANFAYIMAEDMRDAIARLAWVEGVRIKLLDHFAAEKINHGIARRLGFAEVFDDAAGDLRAVRDLFRRRAYLGRFSALIEALREDGRSDKALLAISIGELLELGSDPRREELVRRFLERRSEFGGSASVADLAFRKPDGAMISGEELRDYLREIRMGRRSAEANGEMCRMLLKARRDFPTPPEQPAPATLNIP